jgi:hypothetical protein
MGRRTGAGDDLANRVAAGAGSGGAGNGGFAAAPPKPVILRAVAGSTPAATAGRGGFCDCASLRAE